MDYTFILWTLFGYSSIGLLYLRWFFQVRHAKKTGRPLIPKIFWGITFAAVLIDLAYATHIRDPVYIGQGILAVFFNAFLAYTNISLEVTKK